MVRTREELTAEVRAWIQADLDPDSQRELELLLKDEVWTELEERFSGPLEFGTAGLRGLIGAGPSRMNRLTVAQASAALAQQLLNDIPRAAERGVVVARDGRRMSPEFAQVTAQTLMGYGLLVHFIDGPTPTPIAAFAGLQLNSAATVVVTASHNPPAYNGYKVYGAAHHQIVSPQDARIRLERERIVESSSFRTVGLETGRSRGLLKDVPLSIIEDYYAAISAQCMGPVKPEAQIRIVTTALHGVGHRFLARALEERGFTELFPVVEQSEPDGRFPTVTFPNPEEDGALDLATDLGLRVGAELLIANDPDADRLACGVFTEEGIQLLTGNEIGILLADWLLSRAQSTDRLPPQSAVISTVVSTQMLDAVAVSYGVQCHRTLTGFKVIWEKALELSEEGVDFRFGFEEALGYCVGSAVRDKDGIGAALVAAELAAHLKARNQNLLDRLNELYLRHGFYATDQVATTMEGIAGKKSIQRIMTQLRRAGPKSIAGSPVTRYEDLDAPGGSIGRANVLLWELEDGSRVIFRPSGTEPKLKAYLETRSPVANQDLAAAKRMACRRLDVLRQWVLATVDALANG